jgi:nicotinic acetylcholine receptor
VPPLMGAGSPPPPHPPPHGNNSLSDNKANKIEVMELSDLHHPSCKLNQSRQGSFDEDDDDDRSPLHDMSHHSHHGAPLRRDSDLSDAFLSPEAYRATQAVEFIAEHLRNEDEYVQVCLCSYLTQSNVAIFDNVAYVL